MTGCNTETWKDIPGYEGRYQVSDLGRVRSLDRRVNIGNGFTRMMRGRILRPAASKNNPHLYVILGHGTAGSPVHQLVARAFHGPRPEGQEVRHLDGDPQNNRADNLAYGTRTENLLDIYRVGGTRPGGLNASQALNIFQRLQKGEKGVDLAMEYGVSESCVSAIKKRRTFAWATKENYF